MGLQYVEIQSRGKQKAEVLSQPYWCWSLICMCYHPISLGTHSHSHIHPNTYKTENSCTHTHSHKQTTLSHCIQMHPYFLSPPLSSSHIYTFPLSSLPYAPGSQQICRFLKKKKTLSIWLLGRKKERWESLILHSAFLSLSKYKITFSASLPILKIWYPRYYSLFLKHRGHIVITAQAKSANMCTNFCGVWKCLSKFEDIYIYYCRASVKIHHSILMVY